MHVQMQNFKKPRWDKEASFIVAKIHIGSQAQLGTTF